MIGKKFYTLLDLPTLSGVVILPKGSLVTVVDEFTAFQDTGELRKGSRSQVFEDTLECECKHNRQKIRTQRRHLSLVPPKILEDTQ